MKKVIRLTESDIHRIVKNSVKRILREGKLTNNIPYNKAPQAEDVYQGTLQNEKDWQEYHDYRRKNPNDMDYMINRSTEIANSPNQQKHDKWMSDVNKRRNRAEIKKTQDKLANQNPDLQRYKAEWIKSLGDEWDSMSLKQQRDEMKEAENQWHWNQMDRKYGYHDDDEY